MSRVDDSISEALGPGFQFLWLWAQPDRIVYCVGVYALALDL